MRTPGNWLQRHFLISAVLWVTALLGLLAAGCSAPPEQLAAPPRELPEIIQDGISIPRFSTAADQLNYAGSGLAGKKRKLAALRAVGALFPGHRLERAHAAMALAYLHLEPEYRFATPLDIQQALNDFYAVVKAFGDLSEIRAKSLWYLGWIHTELTSDPDTGLPFYWQIVEELSYVPMNLSPTAPWANLVYPSEPDSKTLKPAEPKRYWAQVALLEIVRNSPDAAQAVRACTLITNRYPVSQAAGLALKHMLADPELAPFALSAASQYLSQAPSNPYLARDIQTLAEAAIP